MTSTKKASVAVATQYKNHNHSSTKKTQLQVVLQELRKCTRKGITSWDMIVKHRITRTAAYICTLRKMGYGIESKNEHGDGVTYSRYWLRDDIDDDWRQI